MKSNKSLIKDHVIQVTPECIYIAKGNKIVCFKNGLYKHNYTYLKLPFNFFTSILMSSKLISRLLRLGIHHFQQSGNRTVVIANKKLLLIENDVISKVETIIGSRPLSLCVDDSGNFYYGEYRSNKERSPVSVFCLKNNEYGWHSIWQFNNVRHIHGVFFDPYTKSIWITTGDDDNEAAIWQTNDKFSTVKKITGGTQQQRAVKLLFSDKHIYFGSDAPSEKNHLYRMDRNGKNLECLTGVNGPVFYGCKINNNYFFSTAVEPNLINKFRYCEIWYSSNGKKWRRVEKLKKDIWPMRYFQYGQIKFPNIFESSRHLYYCPFSTKKHGNTLYIYV